MQQNKRGKDKALHQIYLHLIEALALLGQSGCKHNVLPRLGHFDRTKMKGFCPNEADARINRKGTRIAQAPETGVLVRRFSISGKLLGHHSACSAYPGENSNLCLSGTLIDFGFCQHCFDVLVTSFRVSPCDGGWGRYHQRTGGGYPESNYRGSQFTMQVFFSWICASKLDICVYFSAARIRNYFSNVSITGLCIRSIRNKIIEAFKSLLRLPCLSIVFFTCSIFKFLLSMTNFWLSFQNFVQAVCERHTHTRVDILCSWWIERNA